MCCALHSVQWEAEMFEEVESTHLWCIPTTVRMVTPTVTPPRGGIVKHTWFSEDALNQLLAGWPHDKNSSSVTYALRASGVATTLTSKGPQMPC